MGLQMRISEKKRVKFAETVKEAEVDKDECLKTSWFQ